jgi:hypothetical protein
MADFNLVTARLATGAAISNAADVQELAAAGITHVLDLRGEFDDGPLLAGSGLAYLWNGVIDDGQPKPSSWYQTSLAFAVQAYSQLGTCLYCHCAAGINRGPSTAYAVLRACAGFGSTEARQLIVNVRPQVGLAYAADFDAYWTVANPGKAVSPQ